MTDNGVININKPAGMTSHDIVVKLRRRLGIRRVGHTGTLDPMATGVLPVCFGKATRIIEYYEEDRKTYEAELALGVITDTLDETGTVLEKRSFAGVTEEDVLAALVPLRGEISQVPPKFSALKLDGKPLYKYARAGQEVDLEAKRRTVTISSLTLLSFDPESGALSFEVTCSKGTYVRSLCAEIGERLGCGATMTALRRTASGCFRLREAHDITEVEAMDDAALDAIVLRADETLENLGSIALNAGAEGRFLNGRTLASAEFCVREANECKGRLSGLYRVYGAEGGFLGIAAQEEGGALRPEKVMGNRD